jgi:hypothetical protein
VHRHAGQEVLLRLLGQCPRTRMLAREALFLATREPGEECSGVRRQSDTSALMPA